MKHRDEILKLRAEGKTYKEIREITGASNGTISFHCGKGQKEKSNKRQINRKKNLYHVFNNKIESFLKKKIKTSINQKITSTNIRLLERKVERFHRDRKTKEYHKISFNAKDVINKFGEKPKCYLTGKEIDIYQPKTYQFDHIIPASKGGTNALDNLGICTKEANMSKTDHTLEEFIQLCKDVLTYQGYNITKD